MDRQAVMAVFAGSAVVTFGSMATLYAALTAGRRRTMREIRQQAEARGWRFRVRRWMGNPAAFRIDGRTASGRHWVAKTESAGESERGWTQRLTFNCSELAGGMDFVLTPREARDARMMEAALNLSAEWRERISKLSGAAAEAIGFAQEHADAPAGWPPFDAVYSVLVRSGRKSPVDAALARRIMEWPAAAQTPKAVLAWRGPRGFHVEFRLGAIANWATVEHAVALADALADHLPPAEQAAAPSGIVDRIIQKMQ